MSIEIFDDDGKQIRYPTIFEVCPRCRGNGVTSNPAFNGCGPGDFDDWHEFVDELRSGVHDVTCPDCSGLRVVAEPDWEAMTPELRALVEEGLRDAHETDRTYEMERRVGA